MTYLDHFFTPENISICLPHKWMNFSFAKCKLSWNWRSAMEGFVKDQQKSVYHTTIFIAVDQYEFRNDNKFVFNVGMCLIYILFSCISHLFSRLCSSSSLLKIYSSNLWRGADCVLQLMKHGSTHPLWCHCC